MKANAVRRVVSYHEAGHAVVARLLGQSCPTVTIGKNLGDDNNSRNACIRSVCRAGS